jgi:uncharacterized linocin/CFP29 family protein
LNNNLGRENVWSSEVWTAIDNAVNSHAGQVRVAQKVFPAIPLAGAAVVPDDSFDPTKIEIPEGQTKPFLEISVEFPLTQSQVDNEGTLGTGKALAKLAVKTVGLIEDTLFFQGKNATIPANVKVVNKDSAGTGLLGRAAKTIDVKRNDPNYPETIFEKVVEGISILVAALQPGPYALFLENEIYADTYKPLAQSLVTPADRIIPLVTGGYYATGTLAVPAPAAAAPGAAAPGAAAPGAAAPGAAAPAAPSLRGLLVSLGGEPTTIYVGMDAVTAFTQADPGGNLRFRVFERVQIVARDPTALVGFTFS